MRRLLPALLCAALLPLWSATTPRAHTDAAPAQDARTVYIESLDRNGAPLTDLAPEDLVVKEEGRVVPIVSVVRASEPIHLLILVDDNGTGMFTYGLSTLARRLDQRAEIAIRRVAGQVLPIIDFTEDQGLWQRAISTVGQRPGTPDGGQLLEGIYEGARAMRPRESPRRAILALTVGGQEHSPRQAGQVLDELIRQHTALHVVYANSPAVRPPVAARRPSDLLDDNFHLSRVLGDGPAQTGGRRRDILTTSGLQIEVQDVARDLLHQFAVTYVPHARGPSIRRFSVTSSRRDITVIAPHRVGGF
ncbi:MAG: hypothetical protein IT185_01785 [Acidobacteria bacterium]|nr:hypothetical protein [Acidobacteriota bacterium]